MPFDATPETKTEPVVKNRHDVRIVRMARRMISDPQQWCQGHLAIDRDGFEVYPESWRAVRHCALGALECAEHMIGLNDRDMHFASIAASIAHLYPRNVDCQPLWWINDHLGHKAVLDAFDAWLKEETDRC